MLAFAANAPVNPAVVARAGPTRDRERYLLVMPAGRAIWVEDPESATAFASMREAIRMATRLPAWQRAFGLPRDAELAIHSAHQRASGRSPWRLRRAAGLAVLPPGHCLASLDTDFLV